MRTARATAPIHKTPRLSLELTATPLDLPQGARPVRIVADRLVKASGYDLVKKRPFY